MSRGGGEAEAAPAPQLRLPGRAAHTAAARCRGRGRGGAGGAECNSPAASPAPAAMQLRERRGEVAVHCSFPLSSSVPPPRHRECVDVMAVAAHECTAACSALLHLPLAAQSSACTTATTRALHADSALSQPSLQLHAACNPSSTSTLPTVTPSPLLPTCLWPRRRCNPCPRVDGRYHAAVQLLHSCSRPGRGLHDIVTVVAVDAPPL